MVGLTEERLKRGVPDALVVTYDLGAVGFCYNPKAHAGKHPGDTFIVMLTPAQKEEIEVRAVDAGERG